MPIDLGEITVVVDIEPNAHLFEAYRGIMGEAWEIFHNRQIQYGTTPFQEKPGVLLALLQMKLWRLEQGSAEVAADTWLDIINYAAIGLMVARGDWK